MQPLVVGLNIKSVPVETLEKLSIHHSINTLRLGELSMLAETEGTLILSTCNRLEFYAVSKDPSRSIEIMRAFLACHNQTVHALDAQTQAREQELQRYIYGYTGKEAIRHLFRVVSGLDSMVVGETEILGQVARAYETARSAGATDTVLNVSFQKALCVGKEVRTQFGMDQYHTSLGRIAVELAERELTCLNDKSILILGAGEMSELTMKHLIKKTQSLVMVSNRSLEKAQVLAREYGFSACSLSQLPAYLSMADLVFSATAAKHHLVSQALVTEVMKARAERPLVFIDMAVPRDIDPQVQHLAGVSCFDIKQLKEVSEANHDQRKQTALCVEALVNERVEEFASWFEGRYPLPLQAQVCTEGAA